MIITLIALGFLMGGCSGFNAGLGRWRVVGILGVVVELILGAALLVIYPCIAPQGLSWFLAGFGGFLLGSAIGTSVRSFGKP